MQVVLSIRAGRLSSTPLLRRLGSESRKSNIYKAFRAGRVIRTITLLRYIPELELREELTAATNKVESYNEFSAWLRFGHDTTERKRPRRAGEDHRVQHAARQLHDLRHRPGHDRGPAPVRRGGLGDYSASATALSPCIRERIKRFGEYATDGLIHPPDFDPHFDPLARRPPRPHEHRSIPALGSASRFESSSDRCLPDDFCSRSLGNPQTRE